MSRGCPGMLKSSRSSMDVVSNRFKSIIYLLGATSLLVLESTYNIGRVVNY